MRRYRERKGVTKGVTLEEMGVDAHGELYDEIDAGEMGLTKGVTYPDILYKLTDKKFWRPRLEAICQSFQSSHHPEYAKDVTLGGIDLLTIGDLLEVTS